jgi:hypothetical protein
MAEMEEKSPLEKTAGEDERRESHKPGSHEGEAVTVFDTQEDSEAWVVHGLLESAGIDAVVVSLDATQNIFPGVGGVTVRVTPEHAEEARRVIAENRSGSPEGESASDEPAA